MAQRIIIILTIINLTGSFSGTAQYTFDFAPDTTRWYAPEEAPALQYPDMDSLDFELRLYEAEAHALATPCLQLTHHPTLGWQCRTGLTLHSNNKFYTVVHKRKGLEFDSIWHIIDSLGVRHLTSGRENPPVFVKENGARLALPEEHYDKLNNGIAYTIQLFNKDGYCEYYYDESMLTLKDKPGEYSVHMPEHLRFRQILTLLRESLFYEETMNGIMPLNRRN